jgi:hypothetical protein
MNKKRFGLGALAIVAFALTAVVAQAAGPVQWFSDGKLIPAGVVVPVATSGKLTITLRAPSGGGPTNSIKCKIKDKEKIQNGPNGGMDEMTMITFSGCKAKPSPCPAGTKAEVLALSLPWRSHLTAGPPITDEFVVALEIRCSRQPLTVMEGILAPEVGKSTLVFGAGSGSLSGTGGFGAEFKGIDKLKGPMNDKTITAG